MKLRIGVLTVLGSRPSRPGSIGMMSGLGKAHRDADRPAHAGRRSAERDDRDSTFRDMLENHRPALHREMITIRGSRRHREVRLLFNRTGKIMFSSEGDRALARQEVRGLHRVATPRTSRSRGRRRRRARIWPRGRRSPRARHDPPGSTTGRAAGTRPATRTRARRPCLGVLDVNLSSADTDAAHRRRPAAHDPARRAHHGDDQHRAAVVRRTALCCVPCARADRGHARVAAGDPARCVAGRLEHRARDLARAFNER